MPTTVFAIAAPADDQHVQRSGTDYPTVSGGGTFARTTTGTSIRVARGLISSTYAIRCMLLSFDTSGTPQISGEAIPDGATIDSATLDVVNDTAAANSGSVNGLSLVAEYYAWDGTSTTDWTTTPGTNAHSGTDIESYKNDATLSLALQNLNNINLSGLTKFRLGVTQLTSDPAPLGANELALFC